MPEKLARAFRKGFSDKTYLMGILNITPDSFYDGGKYLMTEKALACAREMAAAGADIIDIGGQSTRPGAKAVSSREEIARVVPVIKAVTDQTGCAVSVDTFDSDVARAALENGASIINDISGLHWDKKMAAIAAEYNAAVILMHIKGTPQNMQDDPKYDDVVLEIINYLKHSIDIALKNGISTDKIIIDPGIGFGKTVEHNLEILKRLNEISVIGKPVLVGISRKSFIGKLLGKTSPEERLSGSIGAEIFALLKGANILRVHDIKETIEAVRVVDLIKQI